MLENGTFSRFDGFKRSVPSVRSFADDKDYDALAPFLKSVFKIDLKDDVLGSDGVNWGTIDFEGPEGEYLSSRNPNRQRERGNEGHRRPSPVRAGSKRAEPVRIPLEERSGAAVRGGRHLQDHG